MKRLFIAEKLSVAEVLASELGPAFKDKDYNCFKVGNDYVAWQSGHILELKEPGEYRPEWKKWSLEHLPIIPPTWENSIKHDNLLKTIKSLLREVDIVIHVGDPDREGQLLVDEVLDFLNNKKPVKRLLMAALDTESIQKALKNMDSNDLPIHQNRSKAALARQRTDWLFGLNLTRKVTLEFQNKGFTGALNIGRVQTPTLNLVVKRNKLAEEFRSIEHFGLQSYFTPKDQIAFTATWMPNEDTATDETGKITDILVVRDKKQKLLEGSKQAIVSKVKRNLEVSPPPQPFTTSALQIAAGNLYKMSPKKTLDTMQLLYEKKLATYGRSDCPYLPTSSIAAAPQIADNLKLTGNEELLIMSQNADFSSPSKMFNDSKLGSHHAIMPTLAKVNLETLSDTEQLIYSLIAKNFLLQFYPPRETEKITIQINLDNEVFATQSSKIVNPGWSVFHYDNDAEDDDDVVGSQKDLNYAKLALLKENDKLNCWKIDIVSQKTAPPKRFTQVSLLAAMVKIGAFIDNAELRKILKETKGIGTEATRDKIIAKLLEKDKNGNSLLEEKTIGKNKYLYPTEIGQLLCSALPEEIKSPELTALMEIDLDQIASGKMQLQDYMNKQYAQLKSIIQAEIDTSNIKFSSQTSNSIQCPVCLTGSLVRRVSGQSAFWGCSGWKNGCRAIFSDNKKSPVIKQCPDCKKGYLIKKPGKNNSYFWSCSCYPDCKFATQDNKGLPVLNKK